MPWFTFSYNNIARWKGACRKCGKVFPRERLDKNKECEGCRNIKPQDVIRAHRGIGFD
jgi:rRNA maturation endonuclease Nob1